VLFDGVDGDAVDTDVAEVCDSGEAGDDLLEARGFEGVGVVPGAVDRDRPDGGDPCPSMDEATWTFMPAKPAFPENRSGTCFQSQVGVMVPSTRSVPRRATSRVRDEARDRSPDDRPQQVPSAADRRLADTEERSRRFLGEVLAHQADDQHHRPVHADRRGPATLLRDLRQQLRAAREQQKPLPRGQACENIEIQRSVSFRLRFATQMKEHGPLPCPRFRVIHQDLWNLWTKNAPPAIKAANQLQAFLISLSLDIPLRYRGAITQLVLLYSMRCTFPEQIIQPSWIYVLQVSSIWLLNLSR
jgi:hypothetical protein